MTFASMTGFAESAGSHDGLRWRWEAKSVNGRSLDLRLRTPPGYDGLEAAGAAAGGANVSCAAPCRYRSPSNSRKRARLEGGCRRAGQRGAHCA